MKADLEEMQRLLESDDRQLIVDYLMTHEAESRDEAAMRIKLMEHELSLRNQSAEETEKTRQLLKNSQRNKDNG